MMKRVLLFALMGLLLLGCKKSKNAPELPNTNSETPITEAAFVYTEDTKLYVGYEAGEKTFAFKANVENWVATVEENAKWLTVSPTSGNKGEQTLTITFAENETENDRRGKITVSSGDSAFVITVNQSKHGQVEPPKPAFEFAETTIFDIPVGYKKGETTFSFKANVDWESSIDQNAESWISIDPSSGGENNWALTIKYDVNPNFEERKGTITVSSADGKDVFEIKVTQAPSEKEDFEFAEGTNYDFQVGYTADEISFSFTSNIDNWSVTKSDNWLTITPESGGQGEIILKIAYLQNDEDERQGTITIRSTNRSFDITVTQTEFDICSVMDDENFKKYCLDKFDKNGNSKLSLTEGAKITEINIGGASFYDPSNYTSLKGIEYFVNLTSLKCGYSKLIALDLSKNTNLTFLDCGSAPITSLNVTSCTSLTEIYCSATNLTVLDMSTCSALQQLTCDECKMISELNVNNCTALEELSCVLCKNLSSLDVKTCIQLKKIRCTSTKLTALDVTKNVALTYLDCSSNNLIELDVTKNTALTYLACFSNNLTALNVTKNTALTELWCDNNNLQTLNVTNNVALTELYCSSNKLQTLDVTKNTAITRLDCSSNKLQTLDVTKNTAITHLDCENNLLKELNIINNTRINHLDCFDNLLKELDVSNNRSIRNLDCAPMNDTDGNNVLKTLYLKESQYINYIYSDSYDIYKKRNSKYIPEATEIKFK